MLLPLVPLMVLLVALPLGSGYVGTTSGSFVEPNFLVFSLKPKNTKTSKLHRLFLFFFLFFLFSLCFSSFSHAEFKD